MNTSRIALTLAVAAVTAMMTLPAATAQFNGSASLALSALEEPGLLVPGEDAFRVLSVLWTLPAFTACLEPEPIRFSAIPGSDEVAEAFVMPSQVTPDPVPATIGGDEERFVFELGVRLDRGASANDVVLVTVEARGGGCANPGAPVQGAEATLDLVFRVAYDGEVSAEADTPQPNSDGTYLWTVRFFNEANGISVVNLYGSDSGRVLFQNYPETIRLSAPDEGSAMPSQEVHLVLVLTTTAVAEDALRFGWSPWISDLGTGGHDSVPVGLGASAGAAESGFPAESTGDPAEQVPGFEIIPLAAALALAVLLRRRR